MNRFVKWLAKVVNMSITIHATNVYLHDADVATRLTAIEALLTQQKQENGKMAKTLDDLLAEMTRQTTIVASVKTYVADIKARLEASGLDQAKIDAAFAAAETNDADLEAAITANTPAA